MDHVQVEPDASNETPEVTVGPDGAPVDDVWRVAVGGAHVHLSPAADERIAVARTIVEEVARGDELVYGLNTLYGHGRNERVPDDQLARFQALMVRAHAGAIGERLPDDEVRAMMFARLVGLARGGAGATARSTELLRAMLDARVHPVVHSEGSVGAADLMQCAEIALVMIGEGVASVDGGAQMPGADALVQAGLTPIELQPKEGLVYLNANAFTAGVGALEARRLADLADLADDVAALSAEAFGCATSPFTEAAARAKPVPGQVVSAARVRAALDGSSLYGADRASSVQDPLSFRTIPQVHGALREANEWLRVSVERELAAADDNPLVLIDSRELISTGNFHPLQVGLAFDMVRVALGHVALTCERRAHKIGMASGLPTNGTLDALGEAPPEGDALHDLTHLPAGYLAYTTAVLLGEVRHLANPVTLNSPSLDHDVEDHNTLTPTAIRLAQRSRRLVESMLAIEAINAAMSLSRRSRSRVLGRGTAASYGVVAGALVGLPAGAPAADAVEAVRQQLVG
jgi:histidine ammonia-lyase